MAQVPLVLTAEDQQVIQKTLADLLKKSASRCVLLIDHSGRCLAHADSTGKMDVDALAALLSGAFASMRAIAALVGETEFSVLFHQGENSRIHNILVDEERFLSVISGPRTTIGRVRLCVENAGDEIAARFRKITQRGIKGTAPIHKSFAKDTGDRLDKIFDS